MTYPKIELRFHPCETEFPFHGNCTITEEDFMYDNVLYNKLEYHFEYDENMAIGCGWCICPRASCLGYHHGDRERIIMLQNKTSRAIDYVYFNAHGRGQGVWKDYDECEVNLTDGSLIVYVARGSHAFYPHAGVYFRIFGLANDYCSSRGEYMTSYIVGMHDIDANLKPALHSITPCQRFFLPFVQKRLARMP